MRLKHNAATVFVAVLIIIQSSYAKAERVWAEYGIASILVGYDASKSSNVYRKLWIGALGPKEVPLQAHDLFATCMRSALTSAGEKTIRPLDFELEPWTAIGQELIDSKQDITVQAIAERKKARLDVVGTVFKQVLVDFRNKLAPCLEDFAELAPSAEVAIVNRVCTPWSESQCSGARYLNEPNNRSFSRYSKVFEWLQNSGTRHENEWASIGSDGSMTSVSVDEELYAYWPAAPSAEEAQLQFEQGVIKLRKRKGEYDYIVPRVLTLSRETASHVIDVLQHPAYAVQNLQPARDQSAVLVSISDEVARARILDCVRLRANFTPEGAGQCSGYILDAAALQSCIRGERCVPTFSQDAVASVLSIGKAATLEDLLRGSSLPRFSYGNATLEQLEATARDCAKSTRSATDASLCAMKSHLNDRERQTLDCIETLKTRNEKAVSKCLAANLSDGENGAVAACIADNIDDAKAAAMCASFSAGSADVRAAINCYKAYERDEDTEAAAVCIASSKLSDDQRRIVQCLQENQDSFLMAAACTQKDNLSDDQKAALECAQSSGDDYGKFAGCMAAKRVQFGNGDVGRLATCALQTGGDGISTAVCMAGDSLTPEQRIALQCAAESPDLTTFALCTGGQLSVREFIKCRNKKFAEGNCFGPNNEIRKFIREIGFGDITSNTVVGQIANFHLDVLKAQVAFAESAIGAAGQLAEGVFNAAGGVVQAAGQAGQQLLDAAGGVGTAIEDFFGNL